jgi:hypothetical protein
MISGFGIHPLLGVFLSVLIFVGSSVALYSATVYANWVFLGVAILTVLKISGSQRIELLKTLFQTGDYYKIRLIENSVVSLPFIVFLTIQNSLEFAAGVAVSAVLLAMVGRKSSLNFVIPTPFKRMPFEYVVGFRGAIVMFFVAGFILYKAIEYSNFNLGLFALGVVALVSISFYFKPEDEFFVWVHSSISQDFLRKKIIIGILGYLMLTLPFMVALGSFFSTKLLFIIGLGVVGMLFLIAVILAKYAAFPNEISLPQAVFIGVCVWFPPLLFIVIPYFYVQSNKKLNFLLG